MDKEALAGHLLAAFRDKRASPYNDPYVDDCGTLEIYLGGPFDFSAIGEILLEKLQIEPRK